ncbi:sensor histidine kinase [Aquella oligotrophica]|uniref:histidine kinase n=1 Tax=Aquella oligotrophica TaxID=2067065 RepID=A0A2I7N359_9NEIS|nr:ATP-binding protein [Aquella oligotrophica]AUR50891.1 hypothetical protein CUN60_00760 [Aquella oligotrophica]
MKNINIGFLLVLAILIIFSYFYVTVYSKYDVILYLNDYKEIIQLNHIIEVLLVLTISFFVYKIFFRSNVFGSKITKKIFILLSLMVIIPSLINIKIANYFIDNTVNRLFNPQIEELFNNSFNIAEESIKYFSKELKKKTTIATEYLKIIDQSDNNFNLEKIKNIIDVNNLRIYDISGKLLLNDSLNINGFLPVHLSQPLIAKIQSNGYYYEINKDLQGDYVFYYYQIYDKNKIIVLSQNAPEFIRVDNTKLVQNKDLYLGLLSNKDHLKDVYTSTLIISVLLSISIAVLLSIFFAQFLIKRLSSLIENIQSIKQGSFNNKNLVYGNDELSDLITAFNEMSQNLDRVRKLEKFQKEQITSYKNYLESLINNLSLSVIVYDEKYNIKNINLISHEILGVDLENLKGTPLNLWGKIYSHLDRLIEIIENNFSNKNNDWEENVIIRDGYNIKTLFVKTIKFNTSDEILYITLISDVTNLIKAKQNQAWADIAKRLAHEIKNPLTPIVLSAERIEMKLTPKLTTEDQTFLQRLVKQIIIQVEDLKELVNKFRDFANISKPSLSRMGVIQFFTQFYILYENIDYIKLDKNFSEEELFFMGDSSLLRQVFHNLVKNAIESVELTENKQVLVHISKENSYIKILIKDNGPGFDKIIIENLFEPYRTTKGVKGSGLGMAIVKKIIDEHNGKIEVFNDNGANVVVKLPLVE